MAFGLLEPPLAAFIAAVPLIKILTERGSPIPVRFVAEILQGAAKPVGSDADGTVRLADPERAQRDTQKVEAAAKPTAATRHLGLNRLGGAATARAPGVGADRVGARVSLLMADRWAAGLLSR